ncbi:MAG: hypothetical protein ACPLIG_05360 [Candidatus Bathyarchaeales archaeon]
MAETDESNNVESGLFTSKFWRIFLTIATVLLIFVGPTYIPYVFAEILNVNYVASVVSGFILFIAGLMLLFFLGRKKILSF